VVSVPPGALEFCKATVTSSDLVTGEAASNVRPTSASDSVPPKLYANG
jgi:hypothetical protein